MSYFTEDAVGIDVEGYLNLRYSTRCWRNACEVEAADGLIVVGHRALALEDVNLNLGLVRSSSSRGIPVGSRREDLRFLGGYGGVGIDKTCHYAAEGLDTERKGCDIEQKDILDFAGEDTALDGGADGVLWLATFGSNRHNMTPLLGTLPKCPRLRTLLK